MPISVLPKQPRPGENCVVCVHGRDEAVHFFFVPPREADATHGFFAVRRDGSRCGPIRWVLLCEVCFKRYRHNAFACPCSSDFVWREGDRVAIRREPGGAN